MTQIPLDHVLFVVIALSGPLVDRYWFYPWLTRRVEAGAPHARIHAYIAGMSTSWGFAAGILALWVWRGRSWNALRLGASTPLQLAIGFAMAALYAAFMFVQWRAIVARSERVGRLARKFTAFEPLMPHTAGDRWGFAALSITAGICEELIYRGFIIWYLGVWTGLIPAIVISSLLFGFAHFYLGIAHVWKTALVGLFFALLAVGAGSLAPAMLIHALQDLVAGDLAYRAFNAPAEA
jgi:CAAX protease family protein